MKKIIAILLIAIYFFNLAGYSILFNYLIQRVNKHTVQQLDNNAYSDDDLVQVKVPLYVPYYSDWKDYERYNGEIELNGIHYNFVKRKVCNDTLYLLCLPNYAKTELYKARNDFSGKTAADSSPSSSKEGSNTTGKKAGVETEYSYCQHVQYMLLPLSAGISNNNIFSPRLTSCFIPLPPKPPEAIS